MQVTKRESYAIKNENEINLRAEASSHQQTSATQTTQEIVNSPTQAKAAIDFANARKIDDQLQANLMKDHLNGLQKEATKLTGENVGVIKDNLGKDIARHDGPGISDMFNMARKQGLEKGNPLADQPSIDRGKKIPDMPYRKNDPSLVSQGNALDPKYNPDKVDHVDTPWSPEQVKEVLDKAGIKVDEALWNKATGKEPSQDDDTKYVDPDHNDGTQIEKPKDPPPNAHDRLGHKVDSGNTLVPEYDAKSVLQMHKDRNKPLIHTDPDAQPLEILFDPSNPPSAKGDELKNTGNPINNNSLRPSPAPSGDKPYTNGDSNQS